MAAAAEVSGIPVSHIEKDFWITEALRGIASASTETRCTVIFKGGTSLSKVHRIIHRFSEDVDLVVVFPQNSKKARHSILKKFAAGAEAATGITGQTDASTVTRGVKRTVTLGYPAVFSSIGLKPGVVMEIGSRGGGIPSESHQIRSLIAEHADDAGLDTGFDESEPVTLLVLDPVRTLVEKLMILHDAAVGGNKDRRVQTARHYYDVDALLRVAEIRNSLARLHIDVLAREVAQHSTAAGLSSTDRPSGGFAHSPAWGKNPDWLVQAYNAVTSRLVWETATTSAFEECCARIREHASLL